jgi:hypothetical protein
MYGPMVLVVVGALECTDPWQLGRPNFNVRTHGSWGTRMYRGQISDVMSIFNNIIFSTFTVHDSIYPEVGGITVYCREIVISKIFEKFQKSLQYTVIPSVRRQMESQYTVGISEVSQKY